METPRSLRERPLVELLAQAVRHGSDGVVVLRCRQGLRHGIWIQAGFVVGAHVAGRFDPLLELLRREGALSSLAHHACLQGLGQTCGRAGDLALEMGVPHLRLRDVLRTQLIARVAALLALGEADGYDACFEPRPVPESEFSVRMPLGSLMRHAARPKEGRALERQKLRALAKALHPDLHMQLSSDVQTRLSEQLSRATAAYHGFEPGA